MVYLILSQIKDPGVLVLTVYVMSGRVMEMVYNKLSILKLTAFYKER
jgi:hypothetical protein